jgi:CRP-like cAMP-binding protein
LKFTPLSDNNVSVLEALCSREKRLGGRVDIFVEGDAPRSTFVIRDGTACRYLILVDGRRQILTFLIPGDFVCVHALLLKSIDHFIGTIGPTRLARIGRRGAPSCS